MAQCKACGNDNPADARYCGKCGKPMPVGIAGNPAPAPVGYRYVALALTGMVLAGVIGYALGYLAGRAAATESAAQSAAADTARPGKAARATQPKPRKTEDAVPAASQAPAAGSEHWAKMRSELEACGTFNLVCSEKVRWRYCKDYWGKVPECPQSSPN